MTRALARHAALVVVCAFVPDFASAQSTTASITGTIATHDGARLPMASIALTHQESGRVARGASNEFGTFLFDNLEAGTYDIHIDAPGFEHRAVSSVVVPGGATHRVAITLAPASVTEHVTVAAAMPRDSLETTEAVWAAW